MLNNEITTYINEFAKNNSINLDSGLLKYDDFGAITIDIVSSINISHIGNLYNSLKKLADKEFSPILNETYTGVNLFEYDFTTIFNIDYDYVFVKNKEKVISFLNEKCNENLIFELVDKIEKLAGLNIKQIQLKHSSQDKELFLKYQDENHKNGIYDLNILNSQRKELKYELELVKAYIKVVDNFDEVITIFRESKNSFLAIEKLTKTYSFSNDVSEEIINCSLFALNNDKKFIYEDEQKILTTQVLLVEELISTIKKA